MYKKLYIYIYIIWVDMNTYVRCQMTYAIPDYTVIGPLIHSSVVGSRVIVLNSYIWQPINATHGTSHYTIQYHTIPYNPIHFNDCSYHRLWQCKSIALLWLHNHIIQLSRIRTKYMLFTVKCTLVALMTSWTIQLAYPNSRVLMILWLNYSMPRL